MSKLLATLIASLFMAGAYAQTSSSTGALSNQAGAAASTSAR